MNEPVITLPRERLIAYQLAVEFHQRVALLACARGLSHLRDQLLRAADSVVLNIAEGAGRLSRPDKQRFYEIALGSLLESVAALDCLRSRAVLAPESYQDSRALAIRLYQILSRLTGPPR